MSPRYEYVAVFVEWSTKHSTPAAPVPRVTTPPGEQSSGGRANIDLVEPESEAVGTPPAQLEHSQFTCHHTGVMKPTLPPCR